MQENAEENGMTINGLINKILTKNIEWDSHLEKFEFVSITKETFRSILEECSDDRIEHLATEVGSKIIVAMTLFWFKKLDLETVLKTLSVHSRYSGLLAGEVKVDEGKYAISLYHELGSKWSIFLKSAIDHFIRTVLGVVPQIRVSDGVVVVSFSAGAHRSRF